MDIVRLTAETYLKYFVLTLESNAEIIASDDAVNSASKMVFDLYKRLRLMDDRYARMVPGLKRLSMNTGFNVERWFAPFVHKWLEQLSERTLTWVTNAVHADVFEPLGTEEDAPHHSSSIADLFSAVYAELDFIRDLGWSDAVQSAQFLQAFAKTVSKAIEQYCDAIALGEIKAEPAHGSGWTAGLLGTKAVNGPKDIANESCVKLCNVEYAMSKLDDMYRLMNVAALARVIREHRAETAGSSSNHLSPTGSATDDMVTGAFKIQLSYAENLKPCTKTGLANPYVVVRVPDGTIVPPSASAAPKTAASTTRTSTSSSGPSVLTGTHCELARSRAVQDTLNPSWDETFQVMLPPVDRLEVAVLSKNLLTSDECAGRAVVDLGPRTRLKRKLADHQTHDVYIEMEPQGRVLVRLTMEGADEDVDFWFRRSKERLGRTRDDFVRALTARIVPVAREVITKSIKDHEAAPLPSKSFFSSLTTATQYSTKTAAGRPIAEPVSAKEADDGIATLTDYLNKNLETLCSLLSTRMAQEVIRRTWDETLLIIEFLLVPPLYGLLERDRRVLNPRQVSMALATINIMRDFFHADGQDLGLPLRALDTRKYADVTALIDCYDSDVGRLRREYELGVLGGKDREFLL
ncbi:hypothetical protein BDK51DRAFT_50831, partial [Blyttiomyces helicus]